MLAGVKEVREAIDAARAARRGPGRRTVLFIDELHRFNRAQQDALLPHVEAGTVTLIGATTENPSFEVVAPLLSRCRVFALRRLEAADLDRAAARGGRATPSAGSARAGVALPERRRDARSPRPRTATRGARSASSRPRSRSRAARAARRSATRSSARPPASAPSSTTATASSTTT